MDLLSLSYGWARQTDRWAHARGPRQTFGLSGFGSSGPCGCCGGGTPACGCSSGILPDTLSLTDAIGSLTLTREACGQPFYCWFGYRTASGKIVLDCDPSCESVAPIVLTTLVSYSLCCIQSGPNVGLLILSRQWYENTYSGVHRYSQTVYDAAYPFCVRHLCECGTISTATKYHIFSPKIQCDPLNQTVSLSDGGGGWMADPIGGSVTITS